MATTTNRTGLIKPAGTEARSVVPINANMDKIDSFLGIRTVADGAVVAPANAFDGMVVREKTSGKFYVKESNGAGGYIDKYIKYPWNFEGDGAVSIPQGFGPQFGPIERFTGGINSSLANITSGRIVVPVKGIYLASLTAHISNSSLALSLACAIGIRSQSTWNEPSMAGVTHEAGSGLEPRVNTVVTHNLNAGDNIFPQIYHFRTGGSQIVEYWMRVSLLEPTI